MLRALALAAAFFAIPGGAFDQQTSLLRVTVSVMDADQKIQPVPRHLLLVSDNPATATPKRMITAADGSASLPLRPGSYTVESDRPVSFLGKSYQWTRTIDVVAGRDTVLALTAANADVQPFSAAAPDPADPSALAQPDTSALLMRWNDSVVGLWTPTLHASGFVVDARGLVATSQRIVGTASSVEIQITPAIKVPGRVIVTDPAGDVAILQVDPTVVASLRPVPANCAAAPAPPMAVGQDILTISSPLRALERLASGSVSRVEEELVVSDFVLPPGSAGGPVFSVDGGLVGLTSTVDEREQTHDRWRGDFRVVRKGALCGAIASAERSLSGSVAPSGARLPVEPTRPYPLDALKNAAQRRAGNISPVLTSSSNFDIAFLTPLNIYGAQHQTVPLAIRPLMEFSNWTAYVADVPPVLLIRATPKLVESFWTTVARGAAMTQGMALPPIKHFKSGFLRLRAFCGEAEVLPIHPFKVERRVSENDAIYEGLYAFDPGAFGPHCGTAKLVLYSEKEPEKDDTRIIEPKVLQQIWTDFASYRDQK